MKKVFILFLSKWYCRVQIFLGLCLAMLFICKSIDTYAYDYGPSGIPASPTPIPNFITYGFDVLDPDGSQSDWLHHDMIHVETDRTSSNFYQTIYKSNLMYALDSYFSIYPSQNYNSSMFESYIDEFMIKFDTYFPFDAHDTKYLINAFCYESSLYFFIELNYNSFDIDTSYYYIKTVNENNNRYVGTSDNFISTFIPLYQGITHYLDYGAFEPKVSTNNTFGIQNKDFSNIHISTLNYFGYIEDLGFQTPLNPSTYHAWIYGFNINAGNRTYFEGHSLTVDTEIFCPLVIFKPILSFDTFIFGTGPTTYNVMSNDYSGNNWGIYLSPSINTYSDFEWFFTLYKPVDWFNKFYRGLTYTTDFEPVPVTPIPTFHPIYTPTPVPTYFIPVTITPITLPVNPIIDTSYGDPISYVMAMINMVGSVLSSNVVSFFSTVVSYMYNSSIFFEILMFVIPAIVLIAFVVGRLKRK